MEMQQSEALESEIPKLQRNSESHYVPAGFLIRIGASILDGMIISMITLPIGIINQILAAQKNTIASIAGQILSYIVVFTITAWFVSKKGGLPGKLILGLKIVNVKTGLFLTPKKALYRETLCKMLCMLTVFIGFLIVPFRSDKRGLHDFMSGSIVLRKVKN